MNSASLSILRQKNLILIFAYAPAGLGHLRVTDALYHGIPKDITPLLLGARDPGLTFIHRVISIHPIARAIMEWFQYGIPQEIFTFVYRSYLLFRTDRIYEQLNTILDQRIEVPKKLLIVATHFGLAHQLAKIKHQLEQQRNIQIFLVVQVTDDSPQHIWYTPGADLTIVPSQYTKEKLIHYGQKRGYDPIPFEVSPYPVSPLLTENLSQVEIKNKFNQLLPDGHGQIHLSLPISGAAVGTGQFTSLVDQLNRQTDRFQFHILCKKAPYTETFISEMLDRPNVHIRIFNHDREVVDAYEQLYSRIPISLEITKPSEQAFKALIAPDRVGGAILLFSRPVGRQEYDNLNFLRRHNLLPTATQQELLLSKARVHEPLSDKELLTISEGWRGLLLPENPSDSARFIWWCHQQGLFAKMISKKYNESTFTNEFSPHGVREFWKKVVDHIKK